MAFFVSMLVISFLAPKCWILHKDNNFLLEQYDLLFNENEDLKKGVADLEKAKGEAVEQRDSFNRKMEDANAEKNRAEQQRDAKQKERNEQENQKKKVEEEKKAAENRAAELQVGKIVLSTRINIHSILTPFWTCCFREVAFSSKRSLLNNHS